MIEMHRKGWTLVETAVVVVVVGVGIALLIPALVSMREGSRRRSCAANLRQLGVALQSYHQANGMLPPAAIHGRFDRRIKLANRMDGGVEYSVAQNHANWVILLLSYLNHDDLAAAFVPGVPVTDPANRAIQAAELPVMTCPSDTYHRADNLYRMVPAEGAASEFCRGNYAINGGVSDIREGPGYPWEPVPNGRSHDYLGTAGNEIERIWGSGVAGINKCFSVQDFENGLSNLVGIDEIRAGLTPDDCRGVWALGEVGASITWGHGLIGDDMGPNCRSERGDDTIGCNQLHESLGKETLAREGMPCCWYTPAQQATSRSMHPGGVQVLVMDGSARFIADSVDLNVWHAIHSRESHEAELPPDADSSVGASTQKLAHEGSSLAQTRSAETGGAHIINSIGMKMARIPAGEFIMGLPDVGEEAAASADVPPHRVRITRDFYMGVYEVTQGQYEQVMGNNPSWHTPTGGGKLEVLDQDPRQFPVEQVSWIDATTFCHRLSALPAERAARRRYRLPTEAQWEYACRAGSTSPFQYPASGDPDKKSGFNMRPNRINGLPITKVGSYPPNALGLHDMRGNVMEWCADWFAWDYYKQSPVDDPQGPASGSLRVVRGADWRFSGMACKYTRFDAEPWRSNPFIGFRVICEQGSDQGTP